MAQPLVGSMSAPLIPDSAIRASACIPGWEGKKSRKDLKNEFFWCSSIRQPDAVWLQWDFGKVQHISQVWTKSYNKANGVHAYRLSHSLDGKEWQKHPGVFSGLSLEDTTTLDQPIVARWMRLHVLRWTGNAALQVEVFGFPTLERTLDITMQATQVASKALVEVEDLVKTSPAVQELLTMQPSVAAQLSSMSTEIAGLSSGIASIQSKIAEFAKVVFEPDGKVACEPDAKVGTSHTEPLNDTQARSRFKLKFKGDIYRVLLNCKLAEVQYDDINAKVTEAIGQSLASLKTTFYIDEDGDRCVLNAGTFSDFLLTECSEDISNHVVKLDLTPSIENSKQAGFSQVLEHEEEYQDEEMDADDHLSGDGLHLNDVTDDGCEMVNESGHYFVKRTLLPTPDGDYKTVSALQVGDYVLGGNGQNLQVTHKIDHPRQLRKLTTFRTASAELTVTSNHRIVVRGSARVEKPSGSLELGDLVICGSKPQKVSKVLKFEQRLQLVELRFSPDEPVETLMTTPCGILTKGGRGYADVAFEHPSGACFVTRPLGPLGPYSLEEVVGKEYFRRARSCER